MPRTTFDLQQRYVRECSPEGDWCLPNR